MIYTTLLYMRPHWRRVPLATREFFLLVMVVFYSSGKSVHSCSRRTLTQQAAPPPSHPRHTLTPLAYHAYTQATGSYAKFEAWLQMKEKKFLVAGTPVAADFHLFEMIDQHEVSVS